MFVAPHIEWAALTPVLILLGAAVIGVLVEAFVPRASRRLVQLALSALAVAGALVAVTWRWTVVQSSGPRELVAGALREDGPALLAQAVLLVLSLLALLVIADRSRGEDGFAPTAAAVPGSEYEDQARRAGLAQTEVFPLTMFAVTGMLVFPAAADLLTMFIALEVLSLPLYLLAGLARYRRLLSQEASLKYFLLGAFSSAFFLMGLALLYGYAGSVRLDELAVAVPAMAGMDGLLLAGSALVIVGLLFKVGAVPFHAWTPDVYQGAPTSVTGFMAACTKVAAFAALLRFVYVVTPGLTWDLAPFLWTVAILTMVVGTVVGAVQTDVKRLLAYSAIAHAGFLLVGVVGPDGAGAQAVLFYLLAYGLASIGAFAVVTLVRERTVSGDESADRSPTGPVPDDGVVLGEATRLAQWAGLGRRAPWLTAAFSLFLLSMAGIPLTAGFVAKFGVFSAAVEAGAWPLALLGVLASAVSVFFYVRVIVLMVLTPPPARDPGTASTGSGPAAGAAPTGSGTAGGGGTATVTGEATRTLVSRTVVTVVGSRGPAAFAIAVCAVGVLLLGVLPAGALDLVGQAAQFRP